jgi:hypothetical protein
VGTGLSEPVRHAVPAAVRRVSDILAALNAATGERHGTA